MNYQLELFMNFEDVIELDTISATSDRVNGFTKVRFDLKKEFTEIGSYLKDQCFVIQIVNLLSDLNTTIVTHTTVNTLFQKIV